MLALCKRKTFILKPIHFTKQRPFMNPTRIALIATAAILTSCATSPSTPAGGPKPTVLFSNSDIVVRLLGSKNQPQMTSRCWLYVRLENNSDRDLKPSFNMLLLDSNENTLMESTLNFPTVLPKKSFEATHYTFTDWTCDRVASVRLTPLNR